MAPLFGQQKRYGLVLAPHRPKDWWLGGISGITDRVVLREDGQWDSYLPPLEIQRNPYFDTMACVTFAQLNVIETLFRRVFDLKPNYSDRFTAKGSGTTFNGNTMADVAEFIRKTGLVDEASWPFGAWIKEFDTYYAELPAELFKEAEAFKAEWKLEYEFVWDTQDALIEALRYSPVAAAIHAYCPIENDIHQRCSGPGNHLITVYGYVIGQYWKIYDHYEKCFKKLAWDTRFYGALIWSVSKNNPTPMPIYKFEEDTMYFVAEGRGEEFAFIAGKLRHDDPNKMSRQIFYRRDGDAKGRYKTISFKELEGIDAYDLKGNNLGPAKALAV